MKKIIIFLIITIFIPKNIFGQIIFSEIMYNPEGPDTGFEWIEIYNNSSQNINISKWRFCEDTKCHFLKHQKEGEQVEIKENSYAIITTSIEKYFQVSNFSDNIIKSSFSLRNTGEKLILKNEQGNVVDSVNYSNSIGADGDGNSISLINKLWKSSKPTPGKTNKIESENIATKSISQKNTNSTNNTSNKNLGKIDLQKETETQIKKRFSTKNNIKIGIDQTGILLPKTETQFDLSTTGINIDDLQNKDIVWTMGNGDTETGKRIFYSYDYPGEYIVNVEIKNKQKQLNGIIKIKVIDPKLEILKVNYNDNYIKIKNNSEHILDLYNWKIKTKNSIFKIPKKTYIDAFRSIIFTQKITWLDFEKEKEVFLYYPDNTFYSKYNFQKKEKEEIEKKLKKIQSKIFFLQKQQQTNKNIEKLINSKKVKNKQKQVLLKTKSSTQKLQNIKKETSDSLKNELQENIKNINVIINNQEENYKKIKINQGKLSFWSKNLYIILLIIFQIIIISILFLIYFLKNKNPENQFEIEEINSKK